MTRFRIQSVGRVVPLVTKPDPVQLALTRLPARKLASLPLPGRQTAHRHASPASLRIQTAAVFALLAIVASVSIVAVGLAYRASDQTQVELDAVQTWHFDASDINASALAVIANIYLWNNDAVAKDLSGANELQSQIESDSTLITARVQEISRLDLPSDASGERSNQSNAALAVVTFAANFVAAGPHTDVDLLIAADAALKAWRSAADTLEPLIEEELVQIRALEAARAASVYELIGAGSLAFVIALFLLGLIQFRQTLRPIARLARIANTLAAGGSATIVGTNRKDEIGQLTGALAAWQETVSGALFRLRGEVADSAITLSAAAHELASATTEQTAAATATSASMEILAQSSTSIADTIDRVAIQAGQTRTSLEIAQADLRASGDRTLALAGRVDEIEGILTRIDDIADQTNLLALNAAIEAARAGDAGRGFAVVADEVRRLAEHSKAAAADIAQLVQGAQAESSDTVRALEKGVKQMERGLVMMQGMADLSTRVQVATKQQRLVTAQVVDAIEHIAEGSRSVASTAREIASAAESQGQLAADLAGSGWNHDLDKAASA